MTSTDGFGAAGSMRFERSSATSSKPAERHKPDRRQAVGFDRRHVGAGSLHPQDFDVLAKGVAHAHFDRRVAAAVQHQLGIAAEQSRCVDAQREVAVDAGFGVVRD
jgi:hypothetical protein